MRPLRRLRSVLAILLVIGIGAAYASQVKAQESNKAMLAVIGSDGNLSIYDASGKNPFSITTDAAPNRRLYSWPTWSTDGRLAFFGANADPSDPYNLRVFVQDSVTAGGSFQVAYTSPDEIYTYSYWSPGDCGSGNCRDLALLYTPPDQSGLAVRMIRDDHGKFSDKVIGNASPFYYSFSPDGQQMLWHRSNSHLEIYDVSGDKVKQQLDDKAGQFQAPMWSPVDDRLLFGTVSDSADKTDVVVAQGEKRQILLRSLEAPVSLAWSPDATQIASVAGYSHVVITDAKTGTMIATSPESNVISYFWSPQGDRIAYLVLNRDQSGVQARYRPNGRTGNVGQQATATLSWLVMDAKTGKSSELTSFVPTRDMIYYLNFFDQFSRSHSLWSPDGHYLVYGAVDSNNHATVLLTDTQKPGTTVKVADGTIGIWSWK